MMALFEEKLIIVIFCFYNLKFLFQMKLLHPVNNRKVVGFSETERFEAKNAIYKNVIDSIMQVLKLKPYFKENYLK